MKRYRWLVIFLNLLVLLVFFTSSILKKEEILSEGKLILLELAPVDPRSLMQGDYMRLRYAISDNIYPDSIPKRGFCVVKLDSNGVAQRVRLQKEREPFKTDEHIIEYTAHEWMGINVGAESYFFQEGEAEKYENAAYGGIKVDGQGNSILIGLFDENRIQIE
nr:GDYXXLXY domain-containing protein [Allomuricauda sp.]